MAPALCRDFPEVRFLWVGDGILRGQFEEQIGRMGLEERFIFTGLVPPGRIPELTNAMDVLVHPSRREGLARAIPQGALAGKPVVTYDVDGNREGLIDGRTGFLVPAFDRTVFAVRLAELLKDEALREGMGRKGREFALSRFSAPKMVESLEQVYAEALK
jgi:glycosyltransferase involved in cell wall biosynthesis